MSIYSLIKFVHVTCAVLSVSLFVLRVGLDFSGRPRWRRSALRWLPHANDTLLLGAAVALAVMGGWNPFVYHWLGAKILLLCGYIAAGMVALRQHLGRRTRLTGAAFALVQVALIFYLAIRKPALL
ncbi:SirB2 family protein [Microbulbifer magnicolonia]|uniref:SirB2 family protein n=1 Tax=Microbulbifer magnicolonia TaxID=3109744 RepID=UPI002B40B06F|nr:SirB2 family protein [Microbulbifer sp. GG15]